LDIALTFFSDELIGAQSRLAGAAINHRIGKGST
jgi:hypothetical protein